MEYDDLMRLALAEAELAIPHGSVVDVDGSVQVSHQMAIQGGRGLRGMRARWNRSTVALLLAFSLVAGACGSNGEDDGNSGDASQEDTSEENDHVAASGQTSSPVSLRWKPADPDVMLLDTSDLDGWEVLTQPNMVDDDELRNDLLLPCDMESPSGFGAGGAANVQLYHPDDDILVWHTMARQSLADAEQFLSDVRQSAEDCDESWERSTSEGEHELRMVDGPQATMRADGTWTYTIEWRDLEGVVRRSTTVVHVRCHGDVARLAISHSSELVGAVVIVDELAEQAAAALRTTESGGVRLCSNVIERMRGARSVPTVPTEWRTSFQPLPFSQRPVALDSHSQLRAVYWPTPTEETLTEFLDIDDDGDLDPADVVYVAVMWLAFPDALLRDAPEDIKAVLLAGRELFDATPVGACVSAGLHLLNASEGLGEFDPLELLGCGASFLAKVGAQALRNLKFADDTRWARAVDDAADLVTEDNVATVETVYDRLQVLTSAERRRPFGEQCGLELAAIGGTGIRAACLIAPALDDE